MELTDALRQAKFVDIFALLDSKLKELQDASCFTELMVLQEEMKLYPLGAVWEEYCAQCGVPGDGEWFAQVKKYEDEVLSKRV